MMVSTSIKPIFRLPGAAVWAAAGFSSILPELLLHALSVMAAIATTVSERKSFFLFIEYNWFVEYTIKFTQDWIFQPQYAILAIASLWSEEEAPYQNDDEQEDESRHNVSLKFFPIHIETIVIICSSLLQLVFCLFALCPGR